MNAPDSADLQRIYAARFQTNIEYRRAVWRVLISDFFQRLVQPSDSVLDLGSGYGEFISQIDCAQKWAMDLNPDAPKRVGPGVRCVLQDCSAPWGLPDNSLDVVFTSNFFEHLPDKGALGKTLDEVRRCLRTGGRLIAMGPNIKYLPGAYWDFWDHYLPLTEASLAEALANRRFAITSCIARFLPYTMAGGPRYPLFCLRLYLRFSPLWRIFGRQFLVVAQKREEDSPVLSSS